MINPDKIVARICVPSEKMDNLLSPGESRLNDHVRDFLGADSDWSFVFKFDNNRSSMHLRSFHYHAEFVFTCETKAVAFILAFL